ncbi:hypothetical protein [Rodentibacter pneumotropicus]|uniref:hypothetical protein n=1 Tax=Rodentibacter pneumotropicus TaxID=758 RepID=UPI001EE30511|nr:hypothetical protein [Rodentibacter pneumotropicus]
MNNQIIKRYFLPQNRPHLVGSLPENGENTLLMASLPDYLHLNLCDTSIQLLAQLFL